MFSGMNEELASQRQAAVRRKAERVFPREAGRRSPRRFVSKLLMILLGLRLRA